MARCRKLSNLWYYARAARNQGGKPIEGDRETMIFNKSFFPAVAAALGALLVSGLFLRYGLPPGEGAVLPLDDSYIHLQYAWQASQGQFLLYNTGDTPTTGATSLLYMLLLAAGFAIGIGREVMPAVILAGGALSFAATAALVADTGRRLAPRLGLPAGITGVIAGLWFAGSGWMAWSFLSGMETGLLMICVAGALWALVTRRSALATVCTALAVLTRPEALLLAAAILVVELLVRAPDESHRGRRVALSALPLLAVFVSPIVNWLVTGSGSPTGFLAKSWFTMQPFYLDAILRSITATLFELTVRLAGGLSSDGHWHAFPFLQVFVIAGVAAAWKDRSAQRLGLAALLWAGGLFASTATLQTATWHHYSRESGYGACRWRSNTGWWAILYILHPSLRAAVARWSLSPADRCGAAGQRGWRCRRSLALARDPRPMA